MSTSRSFGLLHHANLRRSPRMPRLPSGRWGAAALLVVAGTAAAQVVPPSEVIDRGTVGGTRPQATDVPPPAASVVTRDSADLTYGVSLEGVLSDNFVLADESNEASGRSLELTPYLEGYLRTAKSRGSLALRLRGLWYDTGGTDDTQLSPDVKANGDFSVSGDALRMAGSAYVFRSNPSPFLATTVDPAARGLETSLYRAYAISPYSIGRLGKAEYELRYRAQSIDPGGITPSSVGHQVGGGLASSREAAGSLGWSTHADVERISYEDDQDLTRSNAEALVHYRVSPTLRIGGGVNYSHVDVLQNADGDNSGFGPTALVNWRPTLRTSLTAKFADTYYGNESSLRITHRRVRWLFGLSYAKGLQTGAESSLLYLDPNRIFLLDETSGADGEQLVRSLAERRVFGAAGRELAVGQTGSTLVFSESLILSIGWYRPRNSLAFSLFQNDQEPTGSSFGVGNSFDLVQRGVTFDADHRLTPASSIFLSTQYNISESDQSGQDARLASLALGWRTSFSRRMSVSLTFRTTRQSSEGDVPSFEYREQAVIGVIDYRF